MDLSMKWLADFIPRKFDVKEFCAAMTMSGSKVEEYRPEGADISNVVVGKILAKEKHENADALFVCQVDIAKEEPIQIVTNAKNVQVGDLVPVALDGAVLPEGKIKKCKMRGVPSFGMFCGLETLGLTEHDFPYADPDGVFVIKEDCKIGEDIHTAIGLDDTTVEFEITSNRPDCLSVLGLAREASATFNIPLEYKKPVFEGLDEDINKQLKIDVENKEKCPHYTAGIVKGVKIGPSPRWMRERLRASGVRPINNLVDITNYVMLEYGQPMHAFDKRYVEGGHIVVRNAEKGEKITTLDGVERELSEEMLIIADEKKPIAVAGVMGGEFSGIMDDTTEVVFESAYFEPVQVRRTAKKLGMRTEASARYDKGLDPTSQKTILERAFELVEMLGAGTPVKSIIDVDNNTAKPSEVEFDPDWINNFLGTDISREEQVKYLESLEFKVEENKVIAPSYRIDIEWKADIAEEVARLYGYDKIPSTIVKGVANAKLTEEQKFTRTLRNTMTALGYYGILTYTFVSPKYFDKINLPKDSKLRNTITIMNPLGEDTSVMRTTTLPSMLEILSVNHNNRNASARLFEISKEYLPTEEGKLPQEPLRLTLGMYGDNADFFEIKGAAEEILEEAGIYDYEIVRMNETDAFEEKSAFHPGRSAAVLKNGKAIGYFGEIHPSVQKTYGFDTKVYAAKFNIPEMMEECVSEKLYEELPKFPATTRDLSLICDESLPVGKIQEAIKSAAGKILEEVKLFDVYQGKQIEAGKKSVSYSVKLRSKESTLTDEQADSTMKRVLKALSAIGAELRQ